MAEYGKICAYIFADTVHEHAQGQGSGLVAGFLGRLEIPQVTHAAQGLEAGLLVENVAHLRPACILRLHEEGDNGRVDAAVCGFP